MKKPDLCVNCVRVSPTSDCPTSSSGTALTQRQGMSQDGWSERVAKGLCQSVVGDV